MNLIELKQELAKLKEQTMRLYGVCNVSDIFDQIEDLELAIADEESANEEALYWESLELSI